MEADPESMPANDLTHEFSETVAHAGVDSGSPLRSVRNDRLGAGNVFGHGFSAFQMLLLYKIQRIMRMDILKISWFIVVLCALAMPCQAMVVGRKTAEGGVHERLERAVKNPGKPVSQTVGKESSYSGRPALSPSERKKRKIVSRLYQLTILHPEICRKNRCKDHRLLSKEVEKLKVSYPEFFHLMAGSPYYDEARRRNLKDLADGKYDDDCNSCGAALWMIRELLETPEGRASMLEMIETLQTNGESR